jgi:short-subunit dehydrogenase
MTLDVTDPAAVAALPGRMNGPLDGLVNNAGVVYGGRFDAVPMERHAATLRVNAEGTVAVTHALLPTLRARPEAFLAFVVSASAFVPLPSGAVYAASQWAVLGFAESLAEELRLTGAGHVRVTAVCPGYVSTGLFEGARPPTLMRMLDAGEVAARTLSAVRRGRVVAAFPWPARLAPVLRALLPRRLCGWLFDRLGVSGGMTGWRGRGETPRPS